MNILALDPATHCGWAHSSGSSGTWDLSVRRDESKDWRLHKLNGKLRALRQTVGVDLVVFEAARHAAPAMQGALVTQAELQGVIKLWCQEQVPAVQYRGYSPSELKKHATGTGNASKMMVVDAALAKWPQLKLQKQVDDNQCDALWLLDLAKTELGL